MFVAEISFDLCNKHNKSKLYAVNYNHAEFDCITIKDACINF